MKILFRLCFGKPPTAALLCKCTVTDFSVDFNGNPWPLLLGPNPSPWGPFPFICLFIFCWFLARRHACLQLTLLDIAWQAPRIEPFYLKEHKSNKSISRLAGQFSAKKFPFFELDIFSILSSFFLIKKVFSLSLSPFPPLQKVDYPNISLGVFSHGSH